MAKSKITSRTRTSKKVTKKPVNKWLVGGILVAIIAVVGIVVVYSSQAARVTHTVDGESVGTATRSNPTLPDCIITRTSNTYCTYYTYPNGAYRWRRQSDKKCAVIFKRDDLARAMKGGNKDAGWIPINSAPPAGTQLRFAFTDTCDDYEYGY